MAIMIYRVKNQIVKIPKIKRVKNLDASQGKLSYLAKRAKSPRNPVVKNDATKRNKTSFGRPLIKNTVAKAITIKRQKKTKSGVYRFVETLGVGSNKYSFEKIWL